MKILLNYIICSILFIASVLNISMLLTTLTDINTSISEIKYFIFSIINLTGFLYYLINTICQHISSGISIKISSFNKKVLK